MKFTDGYWMNREGVEPHFAAGAYEFERQGDELVVYAPERLVNHRAGTIGNLLLTTDLNMPMAVP